jgi:8-oxo-dGTP diphosphatase
MESNEKMYSYKYPHPAVTTDCVIFGFDGIGLNVLLVERGLEPYKGRWAFPGGFLRMDETANEGALRELKEETNVDNVYIEQLQAFSDVDRDPRERVITIAFYALVRPSDYDVIGGDDAVRAKWFPIDKVPPLAFDHERILRFAMKELRQKIHFEPIGFHLLDETFSMSELQQLYESILEVHFDRRNFYRKMMSLGILIPQGESREVVGHRRPTLFSFDEERYLKLKEQGMRLEF